MPFYSGHRTTQSATELLCQLWLVGCEHIGQVNDHLARRTLFAELKGSVPFFIDIHNDTFIVCRDQDQLVRVTFDDVLRTRIFIKKH